MTDNHFDPGLHLFVDDDEGIPEVGNFRHPGQGQPDPTHIGGKVRIRIGAAMGLEAAEAFSLGRAVEHQKLP